MQRFLIEDYSLGKSNFILQDKEIISQLTRVLRSKIGDDVVFFDGKNLVDYEYNIKEINKKDIVFELKETIEKDSENKYTLNLYQALPNKMSKVEYILQKGVESWISNFIFFRSERSQKLVLSENKLERLNKIASEAVEQSGRNIVPQIKVLNSSLIALLQWLQSLSMMQYAWQENEQNLFFHTKDENSHELKEFSLNSNTNLFVWPEWGWNDEEIGEFNKLKFKQVYLWNRILRSETVSSVVGFYLGL